MDAKNLDIKAIAKRAARFAKRTMGPDGTILTSARTRGGSTPPPSDQPPASEQAPASTPEPAAQVRPKIFDAYTEPGELEQLGVLFMPLAEYHGKELGAIADALVALGQPVSFLVEDDKVEVIDQHLGDHRRVLAANGYDRTKLGTFDAFVAMNDWGDPSRVIYHLARVRDVPSFAKVEGVQDFTDVDTGRIRLPYLAADHVLLQGQNDVEALDRRNLHIVGNSNMETAWNEGPIDGDRNGEVVINSNFTYGVLTDVRNEFLKTAIASIEALDLTPVISQHPADRALPPTLAAYRTDRSMSSMLPYCEAIVTRFSTVPFEAIAYGTPFVYYNPHHEKVPTFATPDPSFEHVHSSADLTTALRSAIASRATYRDIAEPYFRAQIDMNGTPSAIRAAAAIASVLTPTDATTS